MYVLVLLQLFCTCFCFVLRYKHYERWATSRDFPFSNIINDGSTNVENR